MSMARRLGRRIEMPQGTCGASVMIGKVRHIFQPPPVGTQNSASMVIPENWHTATQTMATL